MCASVAMSARLGAAALAVAACAPITETRSVTVVGREPLSYRDTVATVPQRPVRARAGVQGD